MDNVEEYKGLDRREHLLRPECAREFGKIAEAQKNNAEFRNEVRTELADIKKSLADIPDIKTMLAEHLGQAGGGWQRIKALEDSLDKLDKRIWAERLTTGAITGTVMLLINHFVGAA